MKCLFNTNDCYSPVAGNDEVETTAMSAFDTIIIIMSVLSVVLCSRSIVSAWLLRKVCSILVSLIGTSSIKKILCKK